MNQNENQMEQMNVQNFTISHTIDITQYCWYYTKLKCFFISTNFDGSALVAVIQQLKSDQTKVLYFIFEKQSYQLLEDSFADFIDVNQCIINVSLNSSGNILIIEYSQGRCDFFHKYSRNQKWIKFKSENHNKIFTKQNNVGRQMQIVQYYNIQTTDLDLSVIAFSIRNGNVTQSSYFIYNYNQYKNYKLIQKIIIPYAANSQICKGKNLLVVLIGKSINFFIFTTLNLFQQFQISDTFNQMKLSNDTKLYLLLKGSLQIYERKNNKNYENIFSLNHQSTNITRFCICKDKIFFISLQNYPKDITKIIDIFEIENGVLQKKSNLKLNSSEKYPNDSDIIIFPNNSGFIIKSENKIQIFQPD